MPCIALTTTARHRSFEMREGVVWTYDPDQFAGPWTVVHVDHIIVYDHSMRCMFR